MRKSVLCLLASVAGAITASFGELRIQSVFSSGSYQTTQVGQIRKKSKDGGDSVYPKVVAHIYDATGAMRYISNAGYRSNDYAFRSYTVNLKAPRIDETFICLEKRFRPDSCVK